jgi:hypothetical protein
MEAAVFGLLARHGGNNKNVKIRPGPRVRVS